MANTSFDHQLVCECGQKYLGTLHSKRCRECQELKYRENKKKQNDRRRALVQTAKA